MTLQLIAGACAPAPSLEELRAEIDAVDDALLRLIEQRQRLAGRAAVWKDHGRELALKPDREASLLTRLLQRAAPSTRDLVLAVWRELMSAGLAVQQTVEVIVWPGSSRDLEEAARSRFGSGCARRVVAAPQEALRAASEGSAVAVLALSRDAPWWLDLHAEHPDLWVFDALTKPGSDYPAALAVGRVDPASLPTGVTYRISRGGDAGPSSLSSQVLGTAKGVRLYASKGESVWDRDSGWLGAAPLLPGRL